MSDLQGEPRNPACRGIYIDGGSTAHFANCCNHISAIPEWRDFCISHPLGPRRNCAKDLCPNGVKIPDFEGLGALQKEENREHSQGAWIYWEEIRFL